jgi:hypothetical protein
MKSVALLKMGIFNKGECFKTVAKEVFAVRHFYNGKENLIEPPNIVPSSSSS